MDDGVRIAFEFSLYFEFFFWRVCLGIRVCFDFLVFGYALAAFDS